MSRLRSFAIWYDPKQNINNIENEKNEDVIHINFWSQVPLDPKKCYFDFGIYINDISDVKNINIYCPFEINKNNIRDLGARFSDGNLVNALFNENYTTTGGNAKRYLINKNKDSKDQFIIYSITEDSEIKIENCKRIKFHSDNPKENDKGKGSIIIIDVSDVIKKSAESLQKIKSYYFRLRIETTKDEMKLITKKVDTESRFTDTFVSTEIMDFRINDIRSCCDEIRNRFNYGKHFSLKAIHYLVMRKANDKVIADGNLYTCRLLEQDIWNEYIDGLDDNMIAYHFKNKVEGERIVDSLCVLVRFQSHINTIKTILIYFTIAMFLGVIGNFVTDFIKTYVFG